MATQHLLRLPGALAGRRRGSEALRPSRGGQDPRRLVFTQAPRVHATPNPARDLAEVPPFQQAQQQQQPDGDEDEEQLDWPPPATVLDSEDEDVPLRLNKGEVQQEEGSVEALGGQHAQQPQPHHVRGSHSPLAKELERMVSTSNSMERLLDVMTQHGEYADAQCVAAAFQQAARLEWEQGQQRTAKQGATLPELPHHQASSASSNSSRGSNSQRHTSLRTSDALVPTLELLQLLLTSTACDLDLLGLGDIVWACTKLRSTRHLGLVEQAVDVVLAQLLQRGVASAAGLTMPLRPGQISTSIKLPQQSQPGMAVTARAALQVTSISTVSRLLYHLAMWGVDRDDRRCVFEWLLDALVPLLPHAKPQDLSTCACALAQGAREHAAWKLVCEEAARQLTAPETRGLFNSLSLKRLAQAMDVMGTEGCPVLVSALQECIRRQPLNKPSNTAMILVAAVHAGMTDEEGWFTRTVSQAAAQVLDMRVQELSETLWAYTKSRARQWSDVVRAAMQVLLPDGSVWRRIRGDTSSIVHIMWALARQDEKEPQVFVPLQREALLCLNRMSHTEHMQLLEALGRLLDRVPDKYAPSYMQLVNQELVSSLLTKHILPCIPTMRSSAVCLVASTLVQLSWLDVQVNYALVARVSLLMEALSFKQVSILLAWLAKVVVAESSLDAPDSLRGDSTRPLLPPAAVQLRQLLLQRTHTLLGQAAGGQARPARQALWSTALLQPGDSRTMRSLLQVLMRHGQGQAHSEALHTTVTQAVQAMVLLGRVTPQKWLGSGPLHMFVHKAMLDYQDRLKRDSRTSTVQLQVFTALGHLSDVTARELEVLVGAGLLSVDIMVRYRGHDICIEVDGPFHFMLNRQDLIAGDTAFRRRILAACGCRVVSVRAMEFIARKTLANKTSLLEELLKTAVDAPHRLAVREKAFGARHDLNSFLPDSLLAAPTPA